MLTSRLIDRPIRPLFAAGFRNETQVVCTVLSHDLENDPDVVALIGASAALTISGIPFLGPIAAARVGYIDGQYVLNPTAGAAAATPQLDLVVAGTGEGVLMVESEAKELSEEIMLGAVTFGFEQFQPVIEAIIELAEPCAKEPWNLPVRSAGGRGRGQAALAEVVPGRSADRLSRDRQAGAHREGRRRQGEGRRDRSSPRACRPSWSARSSRTLEQEIVRGAILRDRPAHRRPRHQDRASDRLPGRRPAAGPWLGAVHPRRDPGARRHHARHRPGRADHRRAGRRVPRELHAALQLPALCDRRGGPHGLARPARDRPWQARLAGGASAAAGEGSLPLHHPRRLGDHRVERLVLDGHGLRRLAVDDGCRRAAVPSRSPASPWA